MSIAEKISSHINKYLRQNNYGFATDYTDYSFGNKITFDINIYSLDENRNTDSCYGILELKGNLKKSMYEQYIKQARDFNDSDFDVRLPIIPEVKFNKLIGKKDSNLKIFAGNKNNSNKKKLLLLDEIR